MLGEEGYDVVGQAGDGQKAIELARELRPDLVILDVKMPVLDGIAAAEKIAGERIAPVVILTAFSQRDLVARARDAGAMAYLVKPFQRGDLVPAIEMAVSRFAEITVLEREVADLQESLATRKAVDRAKSVLQEQLGLSEPDAFRWIQKTAMDLRLSMRQVADGVVEHGGRARPAPRRCPSIGSGHSHRMFRRVSVQTAWSRNGNGTRFRHRAIVSRATSAVLGSRHEARRGGRAHGTDGGKSMIRSTQDVAGASRSRRGRPRATRLRHAPTPAAARRSERRRLRLQDRCDGRPVRRQRQHRAPVRRRRQARAVKQWENDDCESSSSEFDTEGDPAKATPGRDPDRRRRAPSSVSSVARSPVRPARPRPIYSDAGVTMISQSATATDLTQDDPVEVFHRLVALRRLQGAAIAKYLSDELGATKVFVVDNSEAYGEPLADRVEETSATRWSQQRQDPGRPDRLRADDLEDRVGQARRHLLRRLHRRGRAAAQADPRRRHRGPVRRWRRPLRCRLRQRRRRRRRGRDRHVPLCPDRGGQHLRCRLRGRVRRRSRRLRG